MSGRLNGRAALGALLVVLAATAAWAAASADHEPPRVAWQAAARALEPGAALTANDVVLIAGDLPPEVADRLVPAGEDLGSYRVIGPVAPGDPLVRTNLVADSEARSTGDDLTIALPDDRALAGRIQPGETLVVLATVGSGSDASTEVVTDAALVLDVARSDERFGVGATPLVLTLRVADRATAVEITHAQQVGELTLVRPGAGQSSSSRTIDPAAAGDDRGGDDG